jgi:hypothetical protein
MDETINAAIVRALEENGMLSTAQIARIVRRQNGQVLRRLRQMSYAGRVVELADMGPEYGHPRRRGRLWGLPHADVL